MSSILGKVTPQAMLEASLDLFKLFCLGFKKDKNFLGGEKQQQTFNQLYNFLQIFHSPWDPNTLTEHMVSSTVDHLLSVMRLEKWLKEA